MSKNFYAVKRGFDKELDKEVHDLIFKDWWSVKRLVAGYDKARYKGFETQEKAQNWLDTVDLSDADRKSKDKIDKLKEEVGIIDKSYISDFENSLADLVKEYKTSGVKSEEAIGCIVRLIMDEVDKIY
jgi:viroplasmin and RNaseH domain-containing protein